MTLQVDGRLRASVEAERIAVEPLALHLFCAERLGARDAGGIEHERGGPAGGELGDPTHPGPQPLRLTEGPAPPRFSVGGYLVTSATVKDDRKAAATRHAEIETVLLHALLDRARAYVVGLGNVLEDEPSASQRRFVELAGSTAGSAGLVDALWTQRAAGSGRLIARYTTRTRPALPPGTDVSRWSALSAAIDDQATVFSASASKLAALGGEPGFYLVKSLSFGRGPLSNGYLAMFVPRGWLTLALEDNPREVEISMDGRRLEGELQRPPSASADFNALARAWRVGIALAPASGLGSLLPWLALAWPVAVALLAFLVGNAIVRRRRGEREVESIVESSLDLIGIADFDGYWKRVNPAFERTLGYTAQELLARPLLDFVHPDDVQRTQQALEAVRQGSQVGHFVNRNVSKNREVHWLEWNARPAPEAGLLYASARDITDRRRAEEEVRRARARVVTQATRRGAASSAIFTTARSSGSSPWRSCSAPRRRRSRRTWRMCARSCPTRRGASPPLSRTCRRSRAASTPPSSRAEGSTWRCADWAAGPGSRWSLTSTCRTGCLTRSRSPPPTSSRRR
jgi:PAS domain S-box-containing protein